MTHLPRAILLAFPLVAIGARALNIVAGAGLNPRASSVGVLQLLPEQATACDGGFLPLLPPATARAAAGVSVGAAAGDNPAARDGNTHAGDGEIHCDSPKTGSPDRLLSAIIQVESNGDPHAIGDGGRAVGVLQIWPITVADANRILGREEFTLADRLDPDRSRAIFYTITNHYSAGCSDEIKAKRWCNGPRGEHKPGSAAYWAKVQRAMEETR